MFLPHAARRLSIGGRAALSVNVTRKGLAGVAALAVLPAMSLGACGRQADSPPVQISAPTSDLHGTRIATPLREPDLTLTGTSGRPVNLMKATQGKLTLVYFGYTHCPDVCPTTMADLAAALRTLPPAQRARIAVVFITTDPWRDNPKVIKSWLASFSSSFIGLTGDYAKIQAAAKPLGIALERPSSTTGDYEVTHGAEVLPFGADHRAHVIYTAGVSATGWAADLPELLRETTTSSTPASRPELRVVGAYVPQPASPDVAAAYFTVVDAGGGGDELTGVTSDVAAETMMHRSTGETMERVGSVPVPAGRRLVFGPGGYHVMLEKPVRALRPGDHVTLTLRFRRSAAITVRAPVEAIGHRPDGT